MVRPEGARADRRGAVLLLARAMIGIGAVVALWYGAGTAARGAEVHGILSVGRVLDPAVKRVVPGGGVLVDPATNRPFVAVITASCSSLAAVAVLLVVSAVLARGPLHRYLARVVVATVLVVAVNVARIVLVVIVGSKFGVDAMSLMHDWAGTLLTLGAAAAGIAVVVRRPATAPSRAVT